MYKNFLIFIILLIIWSLFFSIYKYFTWWIFNDEIISLQFISAFLSIWGIISFVFWAFFYELLKERKFHIIISLLAIFSIFIIYVHYFFQFFETAFVVWLLSLFIWIIYWFWIVLKNIIISTEINKKYASDTFLNWIANIFFISSIVWWSVLWWILVEKFNEKGVYVIIWILFISAFSWLFLSNSLKESDKIPTRKKFLNYKKNYKKDFLYIVKKYYLDLIFIWVLVVVASALSQKAIEFITLNTDTKQSTASILLLFSALWWVVWNIFSMKLFFNKWVLFLVSAILFWFFAILLPFFVLNFFVLSIIAFFAWIFFWICFNLLESDYLKNIAIDNKKSYWWATMWMIIALIVWFWMIFLDFIQVYIWFIWSYVFMWFLLFYIWIHKFILTNN